VGLVSLETVELWRPRRDPKQRARRALAGVLVVAGLAGAWIAAALLRLPLVLLLGIAGALVFACAPRWLSGGAAGPADWVVLLPRRWVPRIPGDRRPAPQAERRAPARVVGPASGSGSTPCNPQRAPRGVATGGPVPL
jgi:hypothetical protein